MARDKRQPKTRREQQKKPSKTGQCLYCEAVGEITDDHVPPKTLFPKPRPSNLVTVPCCPHCHRLTHKDDEYFRTINALTLSRLEDPGAAQIIDDTLKSFQRQEARKFTTNLFSTFRRVPRMSPGGIYLGTRTAFEVDLERVRRVCSRTVRGLYYKEVGTRLPKSMPIFTEVVVPFSNEGILSVVHSLIEMLAPVELHEIGGIFSYKYALAEDRPTASLWMLSFYQKMYVMSLTDASSADNPVAVR